jgi:hypothetical protein
MVTQFHGETEGIDLSNEVILIVLFRNKNINYNEFFIL